MRGRAGTEDRPQYAEGSPIHAARRNPAYMIAGPVLGGPAWAGRSAAVFPRARRGRARDNTVDERSTGVVPVSTVRRPAKATGSPFARLMPVMLASSTLMDMGQATGRPVRRPAGRGSGQTCSPSVPADDGQSRTWRSPVITGTARSVRWSGPVRSPSGSHGRYWSMLLSFHLRAGCIRAVR